MKPHEETLAQSPTMPSEVVRREDGWTVGFARDGGMAQLWSAAPEMARALLSDLNENGHVTNCPNWYSEHTDCNERCKRTRAVLAKAGVLP